jgi:RimJ/RimL family protein N-acetyltransferase
MESSNIIKCKLVKITGKDKKALLNITSNKDTMDSVGNGKPWDEKKVDNFIYYNSVDNKQSLELRTNFYWGMKTKTGDSEEFIGVVGIHNVNYGKNGNKFYVTIFIDKSKIGLGYGTIFLKMAITAFKNIASKKLHINLGFKPINKLHKINPKSSKLYQTYIL